MEQYQLVIYAVLKKALYGTLRASLLFWRKLTAELIERGYKTNPYDWCVSNKMVQSIQFTVLWHVDDLKISHLSQEVLEEKSGLINNEFDQEDPLTINRGGIINT